MKRLWCWLTSHQWKVLRTNRDRHANLMCFSTNAGRDMDCRRCGEQWRDFAGLSEDYCRDRGHEWASCYRSYLGVQIPVDAPEMCLNCGAEAP